MSEEQSAISTNDNSIDNSSIDNFDESIDK